MKTQTKSIIKKFGEVRVEIFIAGSLTIVQHHATPGLIDVVIAGGENYDRVTLYRKQAEKACHFGGFFPIPYVGLRGSDSVAIGLMQISVDYLESLSEATGKTDITRFEPTWVSLSQLEVSLKRDYVNSSKLQEVSVGVEFEGLNSNAKFGAQISWRDYISLTELVIASDRHLPVFEASLNLAQLFSH